jgi:hypothetical protein
MSTPLSISLRASSLNFNSFAGIFNSPKIIQSLLIKEFN